VSSGSARESKPSNGRLGGQSGTRETIRPAGLAPSGSSGCDSVKPDAPCAATPVLQSMLTAALKQYAVDGNGAALAAFVARILATVNFKP